MRTVPKVFNMTTKRDTPARKRENDQRANRRAAAARERDPSLPAWTPRGPSGEHANAPPVNLAVGQELRGQSTLLNGAGVLSGRWDKSGIAPNPAQFEIVPAGHHVTATSTYVRADGQIGGQHIRAEHDKIARDAAVLAAWSRHAALYAGLADVAPAPDKARLNDDLIGVIPLGDPHLGMLAWAPETGDHFDTAIACRELLACVRELVDDMPACPRVIITNLGDALHAQDDSNRTPGHGNQLDVDGRFSKVLDACHVLFRGIVDAALAKFGHVTFRNLPGNHDPRVASEIAMWLAAVYEREPRVTIAPAFAAHQYDHFGTNLIGWHHGDRTRKTELPAIMASDHDGAGTGLWGQTSEHVWHVGHEHHTTVLETPSCLVRVHNTLAGRDQYHAGRYRAKRMLQAYAYHRLYGLHREYTVSLARVRHAIGAGLGL